MKKGFSLIELMVVIVIMGIISAVAVPKIFGVVAKSKASEVPVAAGIWIRSLDAYVIANGKLGSWSDIGYEAPDSRVFTYSETVTSEIWAANPQKDLGDCSPSMSWTLEPFVDEMYVNYTAAGDVECADLTPSWVNFNRTSKKH